MHIEEIKEYAKDIHQIAKDKGWWNEQRNLKEMFMLIITELSEAIEAHRESRVPNYAGFENKLNSMQQEGETWENAYWHSFKEHIKDTVEDEIADAYIRCLDYLWWQTDGDIEKAFDGQQAMSGHLFTNNFAETVFNVCGVITSENISFAVFMLEVFCKHQDIDLEWHVTHKMKYNDLREPMHGGKKY